MSLDTTSRSTPAPFTTKPGNEHVHFLVLSEAPKTKSTVKARIAASMALIFGTEAGSVDVKLFYELKADAGPAHGLKGLGDYRSMYVNNNDHENHRPKILSVPPGWMADRAPARASVTYNLPAVVIADVRKAR